MKQSSKNSIKRLTKIISIILLSTIIFIGIFIIFSTFFKIHPILISGSSMDPTLKNNNIMILKEESDIENNQIIVFKIPQNFIKENTNNFLSDNTQSKTLVKRLVAKENDNVEIKNEKFYVNSKELFSFKDYNYNCSLKSYSHILEKDEFFVMGDNPEVSLDSLKILCSGNTNSYVSKDLLVYNGIILLKVGI